MSISPFINVKVALKQAVDSDLELGSIFVCVLWGTDLPVTCFVN